MFVILISYSYLRPFRQTSLKMASLARYHGYRSTIFIHLNYPCSVCFTIKDPMSSSLTLSEFHKTAKAFCLSREFEWSCRPSPNEFLTCRPDQCFSCHHIHYWPFQCLHRILVCYPEVSFGIAYDLSRSRTSKSKQQHYKRESKSS